jgi:hypothetical protein
MRTSATHCHGPWRLTKQHWSDPWIATHIDTGEVRETHCHDVRDAIDTLRDLDDSDRPQGAYTIASGPSRARTGHQRHTGTKFLEELPADTSPRADPDES